MTTALPRPAPALRVFETSLRRLPDVWWGMFTMTFAQPLVFLLAMGFGFGELVDEGVGADSLGGLDYAAFVAPGLLAATAMQIGFGEGGWPPIIGAHWRRTYHATTSSPVDPIDLFAGVWLWVVARSTVAAIVFAGIVAALDIAPLTDMLRAVPFAPLIASSIFAPLAAYSILVDNDIAIGAIMRFVIFPMFVLAGAFFPTDQLPLVLRVLAFAAPLWHGVEIVREVSLGLDAELPVWVHVGVLSAFVAGGWLVAARTWHRRLRP